MYRVSFYKAFSGWVVFLFIFLLSAYAFAGNESVPLKDRACVKILPEITEGLQDPKLVKAIEVLVGQAQALESAGDTIDYSDLSPEAQVALQYARLWFRQNRSQTLDAFLTDTTKAAVQEATKNKEALKADIQKTEAEIAEQGRILEAKTAEANQWKKVAEAAGRVRAGADRAVLSTLSEGLRSDAGFSEIATWMNNSTTSIDQIEDRANMNQERLKNEMAEIQPQIDRLRKQKSQQEEALNKVRDRIKELAEMVPEEAFIDFIGQLSIEDDGVSLKTLHEDLDSAFEDLGEVDQAALNEVRSFVMTGKTEEVQKLLAEPRVRRALLAHFVSALGEIGLSGTPRALVLYSYPRWLVGSEFATGALVNSFSQVMRGLDHHYFESFLNIEVGLSVEERWTFENLKAKAEAVSKEDTRRMRMRIDRKETDLLKKFYRAALSERPYLYTGVWGNLIYGRMG